MIDIRDCDDGKVTEPGFYRMSAAHYHADPCPAPSLSSSIARTLLDKSPRHAWTDHPKLNPAFEPADEKKFDFGSAAHELLLGKGSGMAVVDATDWRTKAAQTERDEIIKAGLQPILKEQFDRANQMVIAARAQLSDAGLAHVFFDPEASEVVMVWQDEGGVWCRAMLDWHIVEGPGVTVYDFKTSSSASPASLSFKIADMGYEIQAGLYERGLATLVPGLLGRVTWRWVFQETDEPFSITVAEMDGAGKVIGAKKAAAAVGLWRHCLVTGEWPRWPAGIHRVEYPQRHEQAWLAREMEEDMPTATVMLPEPPGRQTGIPAQDLMI